MAKVITLDGVKVGKVDRQHRKCRRPVKAYSPTLDRDVEVCGEDVAGDLVGKSRTRRTNAKRKRPKVTNCKNTRVIRNKKGRDMCFCTSPLHQILPNSKCGLNKKVK